MLLSSSDPGATGLPPSRAFTGESSAIVSVTFVTAGMQGVMANDTTAVVYGTGDVFVNPGPVTGFDVGLPSSAPAGVPFDIGVRAIDSFGNTVPTYSGMVRFSSTDTSATLPPDYFFTTGDGGMRIFTNGITLRTGTAYPGLLQTVTVTDTGSPSFTGTRPIFVLTGGY